MTLEEAIQHCHEVAAKDCTDCGKEHEQLALWLTELKSRRIAAIKELEKELERAKHPKTNGDRIRQMTDEEIAESIGLSCKRCAYCAGNKCTGQDKECAEGNLKWLKMEVQEDVGTD